MVDPREKYRDKIHRLLNFENLPTAEDLEGRAKKLANIAHNYLDENEEEVRFHSAMIGGAPFLMSSLEAWLREVNVVPLYAFSKRESTEETRQDGSVEKRNVFNHLGFVEG